jgi:imidazolonepropionase
MEVIMQEYADMVIRNVSQLVTLNGRNSPRKGNQMSELGVIMNGALAVRQGKIVWIGEGSEISKSISTDNKTQFVNADQCAVMPGFVEPHTHLVFGGSREDEFAQKISGVSYMEIAAEGGGIKRTVRDTREEPEEILHTKALNRVKEALKFGITTIEIKSGYGLNFETEVKILKVANQLKETTPVNIVTTFLGAHEIPENRSRSDYLDEICNKMIPYVSENRLAEFCDVFCERGVYSLDESERVLIEGKNHGLRPKIHADQMTPGGGAELAGRIGAISADHLDYISMRGMKILSEHNVVGVLLPGAVFFLGLEKYPPARKMIDSGVPVALSTDFNPGSCMSLNIHLMMTIACVRCRMTIPETITATTINAACALNRQNSVGSLSPGKQADFIILDCCSPEMIPYHFGHNHVRDVFCKGKHVVSEGKVLF